MADIEKVKRGLAYCADGCSTDCPYAHGCRCGKNLSIDSMNVIEELQAEIERLKGIAKNGNGFIEKCDSRTAQMFSH